MKKLFGTAIMLIFAMTVYAGGGSEPQATTSGGSNTTTAAQLAAALNAMNEGSARASGNTVTLTKSTSVQRDLTVPAGVTLELTGDGALWLRDNVALTVNGILNAPDNSIGTVGEARSMTINGNGTINLTGKGRLLITNGKKITLDGVTLVGVPDNDSALVIVNGGELVMVSGAITGNGGGSVRTDRGTFTMLGGFVEGRDIQWTLVANSPFGDNAVSGIAYGNGRFVATSLLNINPTDERAYYGEMAYSTDGITWTRIANRPSGFQLGSITFCGGKFFVSGWPGTMASSTDGENWTVVVSNLRNDIRGPAYGNGKWVFATYGGLIMYSTDGATWTAANRPSGLQLTSVAFGNGMFVAGTYGGPVVYSSDGVTWTAGARGMVNASIAFGNGRFVAQGWDYPVAYSTDGVTWTGVEFSSVVSDSFNEGYAHRVVYGGGKFLAVRPEKRMAYSVDGVTWTAVEFDDLFGDTGIGGIAYGAGRFVAVGENGRIAYSNVQE